MDYEPLPADLEEGVERFASEQHISTGEALRRLVETGLTASNLAIEGGQTETDEEIVADAMRVVEMIRPSRRAELAAMSRPNESARLLIGFLKDEPEVAESIVESIRENRKERYG